MFSWFSFLSYIIVTAITPGANNIMSMINAQKVGFKKSLSFNFGVLFGFSIVMIICTIFCKLLSFYIPKIQFFMQIIGAFYLIYLAYKTIKSTISQDKQWQKVGFLSGALLQFINPKIYIYAVVSMQTFILPHFENDFYALSFFVFLLSFTGFICTLIWSLFGSFLGVLFSKYSKITNLVLALMLVYCALSLFF